MSARRLALVRIHPDGREAPAVPDLTPGRARGLAYLFLVDNRYATEAQAHDLAVQSTRCIGETVRVDGSGAGLRVEKTSR